jgi:hypothetical protein
MADLRWDDVKDLLALDGADEDGNVWEGRIATTTLRDWRSLIVLAKSQRWRIEFVADGRVVPTPDKDTDLFSPTANAILTLNLWPAPQIQASCWLLTPEEITFDLDLHEVTSQELFDEVCGFLREVGRELGKSVLVTPESGDTPLLYDAAADRVTLAGGDDAEEDF